MQEQAPTGSLQQLFGKLPGRATNVLNKDSIIDILLVSFHKYLE